MKINVYIGIYECNLFVRDYRYIFFMKLNAKRGADAAPMDLERPLHYRREEEID